MFAAIVLALVSITASSGTYIAYEKAQSSLSDSRDALTRARENRKVVQYQLCTRLNQQRAISNKDRTTFQRSLTAQMADLPQTEKLIASLHDPDSQKLGAFILGIVKAGIVSTKKELKIRPHLATLKCVKLVNSPAGQPKPKK